MSKNATMRIPRLLLLAAAAVLVALGMVITTSPGYAAGENYSLTVQYTTNTEYNTGMPEGSVDLTLYKVGDCAKNPETGMWDEITLVDGLNHIDLTKAEIAKLNAGDEKDRIEAWLAKAGTIDQTIAGNKGLQEVLTKKTETLSVGGSVTFTGLDQGLYLIHGSTYEAEDGKFWAPRPMLVQVVVAKNTANLKPVSGGPVDEITVLKLWSGVGEGDDATVVKPASIDIILSYDGEPYGDPITLNEDNNWTKTIETPDGKKNPLLWTITEKQVISGFTPQYEASAVVDGKITLKATNSVSDKKERSLKLVKKLPVFVSHEGDSSTAFDFVIKGYQGSNEEAYYNTISLTFEKPGTEQTLVENIPLGLTKVMVEELPAANYKPKDGEYEKEAVLNGSVYEVEFENTWEDTTDFSGSVVNHYKRSGGKYVFDFREGIVWKP